MLVSDVMTTELMTCGPEENLVAVGDRLDEGGLSAAIVIDNSEVVGLVGKETFIANLHIICDEKPLETYCVSDFMSQDVIPLNSDDDLYDAIDRIQNLTKHVDRLPVISDGKLVGVLSKKNLTQLYADMMGGKHKVRDIMHFNPSTVESYDSLDKVIDEMKISGAKSVLVMDGIHLSGIITIKDISINLFREKKVCKRTNAVSLLTAEDIMSRNPITINEKMDSALAAQLMIEKEFGSLPVVNGELKGILTRTDLLKGFQLEK